MYQYWSLLLTDIISFWIYFWSIAYYFYEETLPDYIIVNIEHTSKHTSHLKTELWESYLIFVNYVNLPLFLVSEGTIPVKPHSLQASVSNLHKKIITAFILTIKYSPLLTQTENATFTFDWGFGRRLENESKCKERHSYGFFPSVYNSTRCLCLPI